MVAAKRDYSSTPSSYHVTHRNHGLFARPPYYVEFEFSVRPGCAVSKPRVYVLHPLASEKRVLQVQRARYRSLNTNRLRHLASLR